MGELTSLGYMPGRSLLHRLDPRTKQVLILVLGGIAAGGGVTFLCLLSLAAIVFGAAAGLGAWRVIREIRYFLFFLVFVFLARSLSFSSHWLPVVRMDAALAAGMVCWRLLVVVGMGLLLVVTTRIAHIRAAMVWFLGPVPGVNQYKAATMVGLVVRFLPLILFQAAEMADAQRARGVERCRNPLRRLKWFAIPLLRRVFLAADELTDALEARCYNDRRSLPELAFTRRDTMALGVALLMAGTLLLP
jgi:energy-coupling factor transporter transmembrane protein EcfT